MSTTKVTLSGYLFELKLNSHIISSINIEVLHMVPQFHTGMSSLQNLKNLPLKGDKTYVILNSYIKSSLVTKSSRGL